MKTSDLITLKKYYQQKSALKYVEYLLKVLRGKKESIVDELLADVDSESLIEFTKDAIDEYKQSQQGFIFIANIFLFIHQVALEHTTRLWHNLW